jgi:hypothetical protein
VWWYDACIVLVCGGCGGGGHGVLVVVVWCWR